MREGALRSSLRGLFGLFLISPFLIWIFKIETWTWPAGAALFEILSVTFLQAGLSALFSVIGGVILFFCAEGFLTTKSRRRVEIFLLLPNLLPPLFVILALMSLGWGGSRAGAGLVAVVVAHALVNAGLVAVAVRRLFENKISGMLELAWIEGARSSRVFWQVVIPYLRGDLAAIFLFIFSICLTSFSIPLVLGGLGATSFEMAIYQAIRLDGNWSQAVTLAAVQSLSLFIVAMIMPRPFWPARPARRSLRILAWPRLRGLALAPLAVLALGWLMSLRHVDLRVEPEIVARMPMAALNTVLIGLGVGVLSLACLVWVAYLLPHRGLSKFLNGYLAPSAAIIGFAFLLIPGESAFLIKCKVMLALTLWSFPFLYRWLGHSTLQALENQMLVARTMGASHGMILSRVVFPQAARAFFTAAGLASLWACGDFALTSILIGDQSTWGLLIENAMSSYRLDLASLMLIPLMLLGALCYGTLKGVERYVSR